MTGSCRSLIKSAKWRTVFDIAGVKRQISEIEEEMALPDFWKNRENAQKKSEELAVLKRKAGECERFSSEVATLKELFGVGGGDPSFQEEVSARLFSLEREWRSFEAEKRFGGPYDSGNAVLSIFSGAGGKDAEDWAAMLLRMYVRFAERKKFKVKILHEHWGEMSGPAGWGIKNVSVLIGGPYSYGWLKRETGVHRLVRISPFSGRSLRHTSFALVEVMPELVKPEEIELKPDELKTDFFRSSGPGGQNVQKRETAVRVTHIPTGTQVAVQSERSQERNREIALEMLRAKLYQAKAKAQEQEAAKLKGEIAAIEWGSQIRSYVIHPYQLVKDHRTGVETSQIDKVLDGELDEFIEAELK